MKRLAVVLVLAFLVMGGSAQAWTVTGSDTAHQLQVYQTLASQVGLVEQVEDIWPGLCVRICYGGHAWPGYFDVNYRLTGLEFTELVGHEFGHEFQLACDAEGGLPAIGGAWLQLLRDSGYPDEVWVWDVTLSPYYGRMNPWEAFAENFRRAYFSPFSVRQYPNTCMVWLSPQAMKDFLAENGVLE